MAYRALVSLINTLELIVNSHRFHYLHVKHYVLSLYQKVQHLETLFKEKNGDHDKMEIRIRDAVYRVEDTVESLTRNQILSDIAADRIDVSIEMEKMDSFQEYKQYLEDAIMEIDSIVEELSSKISCGLKDLQLRKFLPVVSPSIPAPSGKNTMVGFDEHVMELKDRLTGHGSKLKIIPIIGMGGIGKTTLARNLFNSSFVEENFDIRSWATISQTYVEHDVLKSLLKDIGITMNKLEENIRVLREILYQNLKGRKYLLVLDDMWSTEVWDNLRRRFPDDNKGSRIILTTRLVDVAEKSTNSSSPPLEMQLLDEDKSWDLFCQEVFGQRGCPPQFEELEDIGKEIAHNCKGLPLSISVIGGLLARSSIDQVFWKNVALNVNSIAINSDEHCSKILSLSYNHLPRYLQPCFLYFGVFREDYKIPIMMLIRLWITEGMLRPIESKSLEETAHEYLKDLIDRNLIFVLDRKSNGKISKCGIHDLLRDLCIKEAQKEKFLHIIDDRSVPFSPDAMNLSRRLIIRLDIKEDSDITDDILNTIESMKLARSLLCTRSLHSLVQFCECFSLLRVLDLYQSEFKEFPYYVLLLVNLRYLSIGFFGHPSLPSEMSVLWNLQVLTTIDFKRAMDPESLEHEEIEMASEILQLTHLRHVQVEDFFMPDPVDENMSDVVVLKDLETLSRVANFSCTEEVLQKFPNLKKLRVFYYTSQMADLSEYHFENLVHFTELENLTCVFDDIPDGCLSDYLVLPERLKRLELHLSSLDWENMTIIGSLPNLEVLKLKDHAVWGPVWEPVEGEFSQLKFLEIDMAIDLEEWIAEDTHFPRLEHLIIRRCQCLKNVPFGIGEIETLKMIEIDDCSSSALVSVEEILEEQRDNGNVALQVRLYRTDPKSKVIISELK